MCRIWQGRTRIGPSVRQRPPRFSNITETGAWRDFRCRAKEGAETPLPKTTACTADSTQGGASQWVHVPWGNCASPSPSQKEGVALLVARTCNEVVPAHKEFLRARQTPVSLICMVCWVLASIFFLFSSSGGWVKIKLELPHFHVCIRYMSCFDSTHAPVATEARADATGLVSMSTRPDIPGMLHLERGARDWSTYNEYSYRID